MHVQLRHVLDQELATLNANILRLSSMVDEAILQAMRALYERDINLAQQVMLGDEQINLLRYEIEEECFRILATQQPTATDLRTVIAATHLAVELERIGDHAAGIAHLVERLDDEEPFDSFHKLPKMTARSREMVQTAVEAFVKRDVELAQSLFKRDDKLDKHYSKVFQETIADMRDESYIQRGTFLLWVGHNLERIGDRATNIAERVIFMQTGQFVENAIAI
ncbi:MAG: phosphate signaling complex protein PhoU [Candidatus Promineifilaceae bacterium]